MFPHAHTPLERKSVGGWVDGLDLDELCDCFYFLFLALSMSCKFVILSDASARIQMQNYVAASAPVILYVDKLFHSRNLGIDW